MTWMHISALHLMTSRSMTDVLTPAQRSNCMRAIRGAHTKPEIAVRRLVHAMGFRFRLHVRTLPGVPDIVFPRRRAVIFVHGCFWHGHSCKDGRIPQSRPEYWIPKLDGNRRRHKRACAALRRAGWRIITIWECQLSDPIKLGERLSHFLSCNLSG